MNRFRINSYLNNGLKGIPSAVCSKQILFHAHSLSYRFRIAQEAEIVKTKPNTQDSPKDIETIHRRNQ